VGASVVAIAGGWGLVIAVVVWVAGYKHSVRIFVVASTLVFTRWCC
jgi:hypothetical protein